MAVFVTLKSPGSLDLRWRSTPGPVRWNAAGSAASTVISQSADPAPWPKHLKRVSEYAGGHHERMDGKGYPKGLKGEEMSVQARIMGIADIFEALTACDRPYKQGMKLSEAMRILENFSKTVILTRICSRFLSNRRFTASMPSNI